MIRKFFFLAILAIIGIFFVWPPKEYFMDIKTCSLFKRPKSLVATMDLSEEECSLIGVNNSSIVSFRIDVRNNLIVSDKRKSGSVLVTVDLKPSLPSVKGRRALGKADAAPNLSGRNTNFQFEGEDHETVSVSPYLSSWLVHRYYRGRYVVYSYKGDVAPIGYIDHVVLGYLSRIQ